MLCHDGNGRARLGERQEFVFLSVTRLDEGRWGLISQGGMGAHFVVVASQASMICLASSRLANPCSLRHSSLN